MRPLFSFVAVVLFCLVHLFIGRMRFLDKDRSWVSFCGGAAAAYVFVYMLPKLGYEQLILAGVLAERGSVLDYLHHHAYLVALAGFIVYFGVLMAVKGLKGLSPSEEPAGALGHPLEAIHILGFTGYSLLVGYLVADMQRPGLAPLILITSAFVLHFLGSDHVLYERYGTFYDRFVRWLLVAGALVGWGIGVLTEIPTATVALWFAFLTGGIIITVIDEELPRERQGQFWPFVGGAAGFAALILIFELLPLE